MTPGGAVATGNGGGTDKDRALSFSKQREPTNAALGNLGSQSKEISNHNLFVQKLSDQLTTGVGNLVDADMAKESARLTALQVQQQLGAQALSIANQAPQVILSLFRGG